MALATSKNDRFAVDNLDGFGIKISVDSVYIDEAPAALIEHALRRGEGILSETGAFCVKTGKYTGRSPKDRFIVDTPDVHDDIAWGSVNAPFSVEAYKKIKQHTLDYLNERPELFVERCVAGANPAYARKFLVVCERASQALFAHQLLVRPQGDQLDSYGTPDFVLLAAPDLKLDPAEFGTHSEACVLINFSEHIILVVGTAYSGEIKKSVFSTMNYLMPHEEGILPMHASCNVDPKNGNTAVFFGLSGTGKTTLSADPARKLVGDDEHGWADEGVFNFEGGCYAKAIDISLETEPEIYKAIRFSSIVENVVIDPATRKADYSDGSLTENTRAAYPIDHIGLAELSGMAGIPNVVIFLTADAFGVLPPISRLSTEGAMYQFVSGFTSKVAGTERGITEPQPTFSTLFGEPFMPMDPLRYADMFGKRMEAAGTRVYLVNTGWTGGPYGVGHRMKLSYTRHMVTAALTGDIEKSEFYHDNIFNVDVPKSLDGVPSELLNPKSTWADPVAYDEQAKRLAQMFIKNQQERFADMSVDIVAAGPRID